MKKAVLGTLLSLSMMFSSVNAGESKGEIGLAVGAVEIGTLSGTEYDLVLSTQYIFDNGILVGIATDVGFAKLDEATDNIYVVDADLQLGYAYKEFSIYGFGTIMSNGNDTYSAYGLGGGAGLKYQPFRHLSLSVEYKSVPSMEDEYGFTYDYSLARAAIKYVF